MKLMTWLHCLFSRKARAHRDLKKVARRLYLHGKKPNAIQYVCRQTKWSKEEAELWIEGL